MSKKDLLPVHLAISVLFGVGFISVTIYDIFSIREIYFWLICLLCPFSISGFLLVVSLLVIQRSENNLKLKKLTLIVNILTITIAIGLFGFAALNPDFSFRWHYQEYVKVVELIESGELEIHSDGNRQYVVLPENYQHLSTFSEAAVSGNLKSPIVYFMTGFQNLDGYSWGYLYRSSGGELNKEEVCRWRKIKPPVSRWYYCEVNQIYFGHR